MKPTEVKRDVHGNAIAVTWSWGNITVKFANINGKIVEYSRVKEGAYDPQAMYVPKNIYNQWIKQTMGIFAANKKPKVDKKQLELPFKEEACI